MLPLLESKFCTSLVQYLTEAEKETCWKEIKTQDEVWLFATFNCRFDTWHFTLFFKRKWTILLIDYYHLSRHAGKKSTLLMKFASLSLVQNWLLKIWWHYFLNKVDIYFNLIWIGPCSYWATPDISNVQYSLCSFDIFCVLMGELMIFANCAFSFYLFFFFFVPFLFFPSNDEFFK